MTDLTVQDVWALIPDIECQGLCTSSCGPIGMSKVEREILSDAAGMEFPRVAEMTSDYLDDPVGYHCPLLVDGRCAEHASRPTVCRMWGSEETMKCPWGCVPIGGYLDHAEGSSLMQIALKAGGGAV